MAKDMYLKLEDKAYREAMLFLSAQQVAATTAMHDHLTKLFAQHFNLDEEKQLKEGYKIRQETYQLILNKLFEKYGNIDDLLK